MRHKLKLSHFTETVLLVVTDATKPDQVIYTVAPNTNLIQEGNSPCGKYHLDAICGKMKKSTACLAELKIS